MNALVFRIKALQPLLVTQLSSSEENSSIAFNFIPGSVLRGVLINYYLSKHKVDDAARDPTCRRLFFDGNVRYLNAYPANHLGHRGIPKPLSWRVNKDDQQNLNAKIFDFAINFSEDLKNPVLPSGDFCWIDEHDVRINSPGFYISVHNASEDRNAKREENSTVYRYDAIATGEVFSSAILAESMDDLQTMKLLIDREEFSFGGSRSAGYGRVRIDDVQIISDWHEYYIDDAETNGEIVILTLLSDAIIREKNGQITTDLDSVFGCNRIRAFQKTRAVGGFNRKWGLPLVQSHVVQAGSVLLYRASDVDNKLLKQIEQDGIGERRTEGFGRVAINWQMQAELQRRPFLRDESSSTLALSKESQRLAQTMTERRLRLLLDRKLLEALSWLRIEKKPKNAQLSRLRLAVRQAWHKNNSKCVIEHLESLKEAKAQFERARVGEKKLLSWLMQGINQHRLWKDYLEPGVAPSIAGAKLESEAIDEIEIEYTMRLLDALLQRTTREERSEGGEA
jgi:CRISPR-associated protein Csx10